ncbi:hypothetical protein BGX23_009994 [Mortierella sp. AD031]|nr:hypothetical protein BGX23_009994 [Mortierella sp. AD031]
MALEHDPGLIRTRLVDQTQDKNAFQLLDLILHKFRTESDTDMVGQYAEIIGGLLKVSKPLSSSSVDPGGETFLDLNYSKYLRSFTKPLREIIEKGSPHLDELALAKCTNNKTLGLAAHVH